MTKYSSCQESLRIIDCFSGTYCKENLLFICQYCDVLHPDPFDDHLLLDDCGQALLQLKPGGKVRRGHTSGKN